MKKIGKVLLAFLLVIGVGFTGFTLGKNSSKDNALLSQENQKHMAQMEAMKELIDENFLFDYDEKQLYDGSLKGMFENLKDPYTAYYTKDEFDKLMESVNGKYAGIGVAVQASDEGYIKAISVFDESPAKKAGIEVGDYITKVDGESYSADQLEQAVSKIRGNIGEKVKITVLRKNDKDKAEEKEIEVERADVKVDTVDSKVVEKDGNSVGYIKIKEFEDVTKEEFAKELKSLKDQNVDGIVMDLRNNPGGSLDVCLAIADTFLDEGAIVSTVDKKGKEIVENSDKEMDKTPMTVLINENSASASEILAGAFKDRGRAKIIGKTSFGKGIVQKLFPLEDGSGVKITISEYFTPNKTKIHKIGVKPDIEVENNNDNILDIEQLDQDDQFNKAMDTLLDEIKG
ncbi:MAG: S41 family peptidase [Anaerococcus hydrogenalis]|uniref:S41 family peptidase n=1 Tax=Anaerococcus hydrogenalis TaxID=33029 RepID=UPI00290266CC|nr:S41 family peptidase [Anaerococcus hydrogenalis]MDU2583181.1 S41 family peptidase [Anaerococcus hydrogenalis]